MIKLVVALSLFINGELVEHRIQDTLSTCLKMKREGSRNMDMNNKQFKCGKVEAEIEKKKKYRWKFNNKKNNNK
jgi:hypothetical protein